MGMDRTIRFPAELPAWNAIRAALVRVGEAASLRMIDGLPAFPDESPEPGWKELRVGLSAGMVTLRATTGAFTSVVWGNADAGLRAAWDRLCWACAEAGSGTIDTPTGPMSAADFARSANISPA